MSSVISVLWLPVVEVAPTPVSVPMAWEMPLYMSVQVSRRLLIACPSSYMMQANWKLGLHAEAWKIKIFDM